MERLFLENPPAVPTSVSLAGLEIYYQHPIFGTMLRAHLLTDTGEVRMVTFQTEGAERAVLALNEADLRTNTLKKRVLTWIAANHPEYAGIVQS